MLPIFLAADDAVATGVGPIASAVGFIVALFALVFAILAFRAAKRRPNPGLYWVSGAFLVFAAKNAFTALVVVTHAVPHDEIELALTVSDFVIMLLLFAPFVTRRRA